MWCRRKTKLIGANIGPEKGPGTFIEPEKGPGTFNDPYNTFDDFVVRDIAGPFDASAEWFSTFGDVQIDESDDNVLTSNPGIVDQCIVRRGSRAEWYNRRRARLEPLRRTATRACRTHSAARSSAAPCPAP